MPFRYKIDVLAALKAVGWTTYRIRKENLFTEPVLQKFRTGEMVSLSQLQKLCEVLSLDVGDIITLQPDELPSDQ